MDIFDLLGFIAYLSPFLMVAAIIYMIIGVFRKRS